jgi:anti-sigma factor RsiW
MNCGIFEILLADYLDGTLPAAEKDAFLLHLETCSACAALTADAGEATAFIARAAEIDPPPALIADILQATNAGREPKPHGIGLSGWINRVFAPVLQPRVVLGAVMALITIALIDPFSTPSGTAPQGNFSAASLNPAHLWNSIDYTTNRIWDRAVKNYESTRLVYEVREQVDDWAEASGIRLDPATAQETK